MRLKQKKLAKPLKKAIEQLQNIVNEFLQDANSSFEETVKKLSKGIQNYEAARIEHSKVIKIKNSYESRWRTNPERLAVIDVMLETTDKLFDGTMTPSEFQDSVKSLRQDVLDSHTNSCFTLFGTKSRLAKAIEKEYPSPDLEPGAPIPGH